MKRLFIIILFSIFFLPSCDVLQEVAKTIEEPGNLPLTEQEVVQGLKEALRISTDTAVSIVSKTNGYFRDELIKIYLPPEASQIMKYKDNTMLQAVGISGLIDDVILRMNRSAENAAKSATPIFANAIKSMTIQDAFAILNGSDTAATNYFRKKTYLQLKASFKPKISNSLNQPLVGNISAGKAWTSLTKSYNDVAAIAGWQKVTTQLDEYVTRKALNGLFLKLSLEEKAIRRDPKARVTDILRRVFGS
ncbi:MAG: DUF4197 domain-containing protein [Bacteroidales bacterium]|nr:DUF4197 domain-containing protein [Bacteroidales bacterium]